MKKRFGPYSLTSRLTLLFTAGMVFFLLILNLFVYWATMQLVYRHEHQLLESKVNAIAIDITDKLTIHPSLGHMHLHPMLTKFKNDYQRLSLIGPDGTEIARVTGVKWREESVRDYGEIFEPDSYIVTRKEALEASQVLVLPGPYPGMQIKILEDAEPLNHFINILLLILGTASTGAVIISGFGGYLLTRIGVRPLDRLIVDIHQMRASRLSSRLPLRSTAKEIGTLTKAFNTLLDQIEEVVSKQKQFIADASHELKTPLTIIDGYIRLLERWGKDEAEVRDEALKAMSHESHRLFHLIHDLLLLAGLDEVSPDTEKLEVQDLTPLLEEVKKAWTSAFPAHLQLIFKWDEPLVLAMDREKIRRLLDIFLDNARKYTDEGQVYVHAYQDGPLIHIKVEDTGIGIDEEELPHIFERFYRVDKSRNRQWGGSGLGLAIAKSIVTSHGGEVTMQHSSLGGTEVHIELPSKH
ncbi:sensor histidine kinase [Aneurinibacillus tyrosinisolvens]|uniref:sensor histidine kinase n=1 Tax=Aneurinibacillus tyrosinisolvens TaxID=1443435 RepID=UPI00063FAD45|nr:HAMP domain-containing sensor histidine kinase [Aneurinibacillus tyrosinisolvens]